MQLLLSIFANYQYPFVYVTGEREVKGQDEMYATCTIAAGSGVAPVYGTVNMYQKVGTLMQSKSYLNLISSKPI